MLCFNLKAKGYSVKLELEKNTIKKKPISKNFSYGLFGICSNRKLVNIKPIMALNKLKKYSQIKNNLLLRLRFFETK